MQEWTTERVDPDEKQDRKWTLPAAADLSIVAVPSALSSLTVAHVPEPWGVCQVTKQGVRVMRWPKLSPVTTEQRLRLVYGIAIRRDHRTRYAALRDSQKQARVRDNQERVTPQRWTTVAAAVISITQGGTLYGQRIYSSVADVLKAHHITGLSGWQLERLEKLWGMAACKATAAETGDTTSQSDDSPVPCKNPAS